MTIKPQILQLDVGGDPMTWIDYEDYAYYAAKGLIAWTYGQGEYRIYGGYNRIKMEVSTFDMNTIVAIRSKSKISPHSLFRVPTLTNRILFRRDQNLCAYCGREYDTAKLTRDHIQPSSRGGKDSWTNCVTACGPCNRHKDDKTPEEAGMMLIYVPYTPNVAEHLILKNRSILADQMEFLMDRVGKESRLHTPNFKETILLRNKH